MKELLILAGIVLLSASGFHPLLGPGIGLVLVFGWLVWAIYSSAWETWRDGAPYRAADREDRAARRAAEKARRAAMTRKERFLEMIRW